MRRRIALSQNFLLNPHLVDALLDRSTLGANDVVYEVGPGEGIITERLAQRCGHVIAVEKDRQLVARLCRRLGAHPNISVYLLDFLEFPLPATPYKVFANPPFNVTAALIGRLTTALTPPLDTYLVVQQEAAKRFVGMAAEAPETLASALLKPWFEPAIVHRFRRTDFAPTPGVQVVMLRLHKRGPPLVGPGESQRYRDFVIACFVAWQPTVGRALASVFSREHVSVLTRALTVVPSIARTFASRPSAVPFHAWLDLFHWFGTVADAATWGRLSGAEDRLRQHQVRLRKVHRTRVRPPPTIHRESTRRLRLPGSAALAAMSGVLSA